ncbi:hypothetical protein [Deinococcus sp. PEB2-67]
MTERQGAILFTPPTRQGTRWDRRARVTPAVQATVIRAGLHALVDAGWVHVERDERTVAHWATHDADGTSILCGLPLPEDRQGELVPVLLAASSTRPGGWPDLPLGARRCRSCASTLVRVKHGLTWKIGDRVTSQDFGMQIHGTITQFFEDDHGRPCVNLLRFGRIKYTDPTTKPDIPDTSLPDWYRSATTLQAYQAPAPRPAMPRADAPTLL